jgi:hypothetical protein
LGVGIVSGARWSHGIPLGRDREGGNAGRVSRHQTKIDIGGTGDLTAGRFNRPAQFISQTIEGEDVCRENLKSCAVPGDGRTGGEPQIKGVRSDFLGEHGGHSRYDLLIVLAHVP